jgi:hypothetical protein
LTKKKLLSIVHVLTKQRRNEMYAGCQYRKVDKLSLGEELAIVNESGEEIAQVWFYGDKKKTEERAEFIVRACNAHDDLVQFISTKRHRIAEKIAETENDKRYALARGLILELELEEYDVALTKARGEA